MHNVILILVSSSEFNSLFRRLIKFSVSFVSSLFSEVPRFSALYHHEDSSKSSQDSPCVVNLSCLPFDHSFVYRSSSWRFYMVVLQGFNSFSKCSSRFPFVISFFWGGVMSFFIFSLHVSWITSFSRVTYLNPSFSLRSSHLFNP